MGEPVLTPAEIHLVQWLHAVDTLQQRAALADELAEALREFDYLDCESMACEHFPDEPDEDCVMRGAHGALAKYDALTKQGPPASSRR